ncbi:MAG: hypothetical protein K6G80_02150 [Treponema sp.]|nr:hypothetical protein [Treponema sp.]
MKQCNYRKNVLALSAAALLTVCATGCGDKLADDVLVDPSDWSEGVMATSGWVMAGIGTSESTASDALHLAYSTDGLVWTALNSNTAVFTPTIGSRHIRNPYIFRKNDGSFVLLAEDYTADGAHTDFGANEDTDYGNNPSNKIYVAFSDDLITWKYEHLMQVTSGTGTSGATRHAWTPRAVYNKTDLCYDIYWTGDDYDGVNHTYVTQTYDFLTVKSLDEHTVFSPGHDVVEALVVKGGGTYYLFARDNRRDYLTTPLGGDIQCAKLSSWGDGQFSIMGTSNSVTGSKSDYYINRGSSVSAQKTPLLESEPCVYQLVDGAASGTWIMLVNKVNDNGSYKAYKTQNIANPASWEETSSVTKLDASDSSVKTVGATVTRITASEIEALLTAF